MSYSHRLLILTFTPLFLLACQTGMTDKAEQKIDSLAVLVDSLTQRTDSLSERVSVLEINQDYKVLDVISSTAELDPASGGWAIATTKLGPFAFEVLETEPRASGSALTLAVGNLTGAFVSQKDFSLFYESTSQDSETLTTDFSITNRLAPSYWRRKEVQISNVRPENLAEVRISADNYDSPRLLYNFE